jgi:hypothetical protein
MTEGDGFDELIHPATRLSIMALLAAADWADFAFVRGELGLLRLGVVETAVDPRGSGLRHAPAAGERAAPSRSSATHTPRTRTFRPSRGSAQRDHCRIHGPFLSHVWWSGSRSSAVPAMPNGVSACVRALARAAHRGIQFKWPRRPVRRPRSGHTPLASARKRFDRQVSACLSSATS